MLMIHTATQIREMTWGVTHGSQPTTRVSALSRAEPLGGQAHLGKLLSELIQLLLQRRFLLLGGGHLVPNLPDLSRDAGCNDDTGGFSGSDVSAL